MANKILENFTGTIILAGPYGYQIRVNNVLVDLKYFQSVYFEKTNIEIIDNGHLDTIQVIPNAKIIVTPTQAGRELFISSMYLSRISLDTDTIVALLQDVKTLLQDLEDCCEVIKQNTAPVESTEA